MHVRCLPENKEEAVLSYLWTAQYLAFMQWDMQIVSSLKYSMSLYMVPNTDKSIMRNDLPALWLFCNWRAIAGHPILSCSTLSAWGGQLITSLNFWGHADAKNERTFAMDARILYMLPIKRNNGLTGDHCQSRMCGKHYWPVSFLLCIQYTQKQWQESSARLSYCPLPWQLALF